MTFTLHPLSMILGAVLTFLFLVISVVRTRIQGLQDLDKEYQKRIDSLKADLEAERAKNRTTPKP